MTTGRRRSERAGRAKLRSPGRPGVGRHAERRRFWTAIAAGRASEDAAVDAGVSPAVGTRWFREAGGMAGVAPQAVGIAAVGAVSVIHRPGADRALARARVWRARDCPPFGPGAVDDLAGVAPQRRHALRRPRVPRVDGAVACGARRAPTEAGEVGRQHPAAALRPGAVGRRGHRAQRHHDPEAGRAVDGAPARPAPAPAMGPGVEPRADRSPPRRRLPR